MKNFVDSLQRVLRAFLQALEGLSAVIAEAGKVLSTFPTVIANLLSPLVGLSVSVGPIKRPQGDFERRIEEITDRLKQSGSDAQALLVELEQVMEARRQQVFDAQASLLSLQLEESEIEERVELLRSVQPEAAVAINALLDESLEARDKRGTRRDWLIFGMGIVATIAVSGLFFVLALWNT